jgi:hypothetical protein
VAARNAWAALSFGKSRCARAVPGPAISMQKPWGRSIQMLSSSRTNSQEEGGTSCPRRRDVEHGLRILSLGAGTLVRAEDVRLKASGRIRGMCFRSRVAVACSTSRAFRYAFAWIRIDALNVRCSRPSGGACASCSAMCLILSNAVAAAANRVLWLTGSVYWRTGIACVQSSTQTRDLTPRTFSSVLRSHRHEPRIVFTSGRH